MCTVSSQLSRQRQSRACKLLLSASSFYLYVPFIHFVSFIKSSSVFLAIFSFLGAPDYPFVPCSTLGLIRCSPSSLPIPLLHHSNNRSIYPRNPSREFRREPSIPIKMVGLVSAAGLVGFLSEPDPELKVFALKSLDSQIDLLWTEVVNAVPDM
jgi:hypothetical protein